MNVKDAIAWMEKLPSDAVITYTDYDGVIAQVYGRAYAGRSSWSMGDELPNWTQPDHYAECARSFDLATVRKLGLQLLRMFPERRIAIWKDSVSYYVSVGCREPRDPDDELAILFTENLTPEEIAEEMR